MLVSDVGDMGELATPPRPCRADPARRRGRARRRHAAIIADRSAQIAAYKNARSDLIRSSTWAPPPTNIWPPSVSLTRPPQTATTGRSRSPLRPARGGLQRHIDGRVRGSTAPIRDRQAARRGPRTPSTRRRLRLRRWSVAWQRRDGWSHGGGHQRIVIGLAAPAPNVTFVVGAIEDLDLPAAPRRRLELDSAPAHHGRSSISRRPRTTWPGCSVRRACSAVLEYAPLHDVSHMPAYMKARSRREWITAFTSRASWPRSESGVRFLGHGPYRLAVHLAGAWEAPTHSSSLLRAACRALDLTLARIRASRSPRRPPLHLREIRAMTFVVRVLGPSRQLLRHLRRPPRRSSSPDFTGTHGAGAYSIAHPGRDTCVLGGGLGIDFGPSISQRGDRMRQTELAPSLVWFGVAWAWCCRRRPPFIRAGAEGIVLRGLEADGHHSPRSRRSQFMLAVRYLRYFMLGPATAAPVHAVNVVLAVAWSSWSRIALGFLHGRVGGAVWAYAAACNSPWLRRWCSCSSAAALSRSPPRRGHASATLAAFGLRAQPQHGPPVLQLPPRSYHRQLPRRLGAAGNLQLGDAAAEGSGTSRTRWGSCWLRAVAATVEGEDDEATAPSAVRPCSSAWRGAAPSRCLPTPGVILFGARLSARGGAAVGAAPGVVASASTADRQLSAREGTAADLALRGAHRHAHHHRARMCC